MNRLAPAWPKIRRIAYSRQALVTGIALVAFWIICLQLSLSMSQWTTPLGFIRVPGFRKAPKRMTSAYNTPSPLAERVACIGSRGLLLSKSPDDDLKETELDMSYPLPFTGSYEALGLDLTWMTAEGRYGPYGYGENTTSYNRTKVDWNKMDWGKLQNDCFDRNAHRFPESAKKFDSALDTVRFGFRNETHIPEVRQWHEFNITRRTALVVRAWRTYEYMPEDMYYLRSLITETSLKSGGEYQVILLVDMQDYKGNIFSSKDAYAQGLNDTTVPPELRSIALLWDERFLQSWYPDVPEHRTMWQVYQPMQLLALHYPEFDHFWQLELDMRFTGDSGKFLDRVAEFARNEPRKQALERSTFQHMQQQIGDYGQFFHAVDKANKGSAYIWGPLRVPEILPIGPEPPTSTPEEEDFRWGVGEDADVIVTSFCNNATAAYSWVFRDWLHGFGSGLATPRFFCPPAITRTSRTLLLVIHEAQIEHGIRVPSEATPPSFALWHGLKLSFPQHPVFWKTRDDFSMQEQWWKGGPLNSTNGVGPQDLEHPHGIGLTFWWETDWPRKIFDAWQGQAPEEEGEPFPWVLGQQDGKVYAPNMMVHPMKHRTE
ncbi:hypothetical protein B0T25DRAFT_592906 [Lasiosphaeria hispida]|uniref:Uncharacterized protein n=1 Tax=Lasiosphaeria hispida TaxID=260671 RepID=A0AAJ0MB29_9PEZI|nr:hypothetical protein B0T25DRAFT_592906 [Lasiosphaeria hispida]